jgi:hypothetical protein
MQSTHRSLVDLAGGDVEACEVLVGQEHAYFM